MSMLRRAFSTVKNVIGKHRHQQIVSVETEIYSPFINNDIHFRGYPLRILTSQHTFPEVFHLLLNEKLPGTEELKEFSKPIHDALTDYPYVITENIGILPQNTHILDALISSWSLLNVFENANLGAVFGQSLGIVDAWVFKKKQKKPLDPGNPLADFASRLLFNKPINEIEENVAKFIDALLVLYIDHGLTSASYAARICASELGSTYSSLIAAASIHKTAVVPLDGYDDVIGGMSANTKHLVTTVKDPRVAVLVECHGKYFEGKRLAPLLEIDSNLGGKSHLVLEMYTLFIVKELTGLSTKSAIKVTKNIQTLSRIAGWLSHISEQRKIGRRIEHLAAYIGVAPMNGQL